MVSQAGRIGINASIIGESPTGLGLYAINLIRALDAQRDDLQIYTSSPRALGRLRARILPATPLARPERGLRGHFIRLIWVQTALRLRTRAAGIEALLNTVPEAILGSPIPQVTVVHDLLPLFFPAEYPRQQYYFRSLVPRVLRRSRLIAADSESTRQDIVQSYGIAPEKIRVIYPGCDQNIYSANGSHRPGPGEDAYLLYVGNLLPHKNLLSLLDALAILRRRKRARLVIRGDGQPAYARAVRERVETLGLGEVVRFEGYAAEGALRDLYARAACLVLPSLREGFGLPVLEAMACGTPVITSGNSSLPEVGGDAALRVDPHDAIELSDAMYQVLTDMQLREDLRERGLKWVQGFSWRRTAEQMSQLLDEVRWATAGRPGPGALLLTFSAVGRRKIKNRASRRWLNARSLRLADEVRHIQQRAAAHDGRVVTIGQLVLFSTTSGDAWLLDAEDHLAARVARDGNPLPVHIEETDTTFTIGWQGQYRIHADAFVYADKDSGRVITILGYPTQQLSPPA